MQIPEKIENTIANLFYQGRCEDVLALTVDEPGSDWPSHSLAPVIGSLCFLGRVEEASIRVQNLENSLSETDLSACHFFLTIGWVRCSAYAKARSHILANFRLLRNNRRKELAAPPLMRFYARQALGFYRHFCSRFSVALYSAERALEAAIIADNFFARMLATDLCGHAHIEIGEIARGMGELELAHRLALKLGHGSFAKAIHKAMISYKATYGLMGDETLDTLMEVIQESKVQDTYTDNFMILTYVRQLILRGRLSDADEWLKRVSRSIYAQRHRRQRIHLNLMWAEIAHLRGKKTLLREKLELALADLDPQVDVARMLHWEGLALKSGLDGLTVSSHHHRLNTALVASGLARRIYAREEANAAHPHADGDDPLGDMIDLVHRSDLFRIEILQRVVQSGYLGLLRRLLPVTGKPLVIHLNLLPRTLILESEGDIFACDTGSSPKIHELLRSLSTGPKTKEELIRAIWGYDYNPLRHDSILYTLISRLRTLLGSCADWLENHEEGYQLREDVAVLVKDPTQSAGHALAERIDGATVGPSPSGTNRDDLASASLNVRQLAILEHLKKSRKWIAPDDCVDLFQTSKVTATRDLSQLVKEGLIHRIGKGRATRYSLIELTPETF